MPGKEFVALSTTDTCKGDSGGPIYIMSKNAVAQLNTRHGSSSGAPQPLPGMSLQELETYEISNYEMELVGVTSRSVVPNKCGVGGIYGAITSSVVKWLNDNNVRVVTKPLVL